MKILFLLPLLFCACYFNERGISAYYYNDCKEYYDAAGMYHKVCDENLVDFSDFKNKKNSDIDAQYRQKELDEKLFDELEEELEILENQKIKSDKQ